MTGPKATKKLKTWYTQFIRFPQRLSDAQRAHMWIAQRIRGEARVTLLLIHAYTGRQFHNSFASPVD
jgi:hypothetical protein